MVTEMTQAQNDTKEIYVAIITEFNLNFLQHCKLEFGDYVQTHEEHMNDMQS